MTTTNPKSWRDSMLPPAGKSEIQQAKKTAPGSEALQLAGGRRLGVLLQPPKFGDPT